LESLMISIPVTDPSQVSEARRAAASVAERNGFDAGDIGRASLVTTELATNLIKHGGGGEILVGPYDDTSRGVEVLALDRGRGMADVQACLRDGYSSAGTPGHGLGAVVRQSHFIDIASWPGIGTAVLARLEAGKADPQRTRAPPGWGAV
jgi:anti-sigma regulatory factor (Ser/Thr protein kinase)